MRHTPAGSDLDRLVTLLAKLPGMGPRSAKRAALHLLRRRDTLMEPLAEALMLASKNVKTCSICGNWDSIDPCALCTSEDRQNGVIVVVEDVADLWALERSGAHKGLYHVLGGVISPLDGVSAEDLNIASLSQRASAGGITEIVLATSATIDGQTTAHYLSERLETLGVSVTRLSHGVPVGGELDYLDEGTLAAALKSRRPF